MAYCKNVVAIRGKNPKLSPKALVLSAEACCQDSALAMSIGVAAVAAVDPTAHGRMKKFSEELSQANANGELLEYSLMVWGLSEEQVRAVMTSVNRAAGSDDSA